MPALEAGYPRSRFSLRGVLDRDLSCSKKEEKKGIASRRTISLYTLSP
jgi:hypothetical protein